jgi:hypothetical protein
MIRYSSYGATIFRPPSAPTDLDPLKAKYRELLELRERVKAAEEAVPDFSHRRGAREAGHAGILARSLRGAEDLR